tara:strand:+ start:268 stop:492 length:225 start_codon:yes stop_codon:yes gene_type:complete
MSLQARKLSLIEYLISLKDEKILKKIESSVLEFKEKSILFSDEEIILRAEEANSDYLKGNYKTQEEVEKESGNW